MSNLLPEAGSIKAEASASSWSAPENSCKSATFIGLLSAKKGVDR